MPIPDKFTASFEQNAYYHIICKSLSKEKLFLSDENKRFFLQRYYQYLNHFLLTYSYCLLDNHCHFLVQVKSSFQILEYLKSVDDEGRTLTQAKFLDQDSLVTLDILIERQFNSLFVSYTRSFNNLLSRKGHLFDSPFKRILVKDEIHLNQLVVYIHANAVKHKLADSIEKHFWSSYKSLLSNNETALQREKVLYWFGGKERFIQTHLMQTDYYYKFDG
jgi:putative transposase